MAALTEATAALQAVKLDGFALADQPKKLRDDDKLVLAAVSENGGALQYASERLRDDDAVVRAAVTSQGEALEHASERLRGDATIASLACTKAGWALRHCSAALQDDERVVPLAEARNRKRSREKGEGGVPIQGLIPGMAMHFAGCCHPLPGDRIVGIVTTGRGVTVHTIDCDTLETYTEEPERWLDLSWNRDEASRELHAGRVHVRHVHVRRPGEDALGARPEKRDRGVGRCGAQRTREASRRERGSAARSVGSPRRRQACICG